MTTTIQDPRSIDHGSENEEERFRIYRLTPAGELDLLATTGTAGGIGLTIVTLAEEEQWGLDDAVGILDRPGSSPGRWLVNPYAGPRLAALDIRLKQLERLLRRLQEAIER